MGKRSAKFLGSQMWRNRDVRVERTALATREAIRVTDLISHISVTVPSTQGEAAALKQLAHRVHQFE